MDMLQTRRFSSAGLLQLTALCLASLNSVGGVSYNFSSTAVTPLTGLNALNQTASNSTGVFTFSRPGRSFVEYRHVWPSLTSARRVNVQLRFRTSRPAGILALLSSISEAPRVTSNASGTGLPTTLIRLHRGSLHVSIWASQDQNERASAAQSGIVIGRGWS